MLFTVKLSVPGQLEHTIAWDPASNPHLIDSLVAIMDAGGVEAAKPKPKPEPKLKPAKPKPRKLAQVTPTGNGSLLDNDGAERAGGARTKRLQSLKATEETRRYSRRIGEHGVLEVAELLAAGFPTHEVADSCEQSLAVVQRIALGKTWVHLTGFTPYEDRLRNRDDECDPKHFNRNKDGSLSAKGRGYMKRFREAFMERQSKNAALAREALANKLRHQKEQK